MTPSAPRVFTWCEQVLALVRLVLVVLGRGLRRAVQEGLGQLLERVARDGHVVEQPAHDQHEVVVDDVAAGHLDRLDQAERRLLAERAGQDDARVVAPAAAPASVAARYSRTSAVCSSSGSTMPARSTQVHLGGRRLPGLLRAVGVQLAHRAPVLVVHGDRGAQRVVGDRLAGELAEVLAQRPASRACRTRRRSRRRSSAARRST